MDSRFDTPQIADPILQKLVAQGYEPTKTKLAFESFVLSLETAGKSEKCEAFNYCKILDEARDDYHFVSVISCGDCNDPANYYVVGVNMSVIGLSSYGGVVPNPPTVRLNDFLKNIGDMHPREFLDNLPRELMADYEKIGLATPTL